MVRLSFLIGFALLSSAALPVDAQTSPIAVDQISKPRASASPIPQPVSSGSRIRDGSTDLRKDAEASALQSRADVEACRAAGLRGKRLEGVDCSRILQQAAVQQSQQSQPSGEGALLELFGQRANVTAPDDARSGGTVDADAVARQLSSGNTQGNAAEVAATIRNNPPPSSPPR